ncbi:RadC family protein [Enterococcus faecalis]
MGKHNSFIREMPSDCLPRERFEDVGEKFLSNQELLAILLRTGGKEQNVMALALHVLNNFEQLQFLKNATLTELTKIKGIGKIKAIELKAAIEFGCRVYQSTQVKYGKISSSHQLAQRLIQEMKGLQQEHLICIYLNTKNEVIRQETVFKGSLNQSIAHPREVFCGAVKYAAARILLAHNHPSGNPVPSQQDIQFTKRMEECGEMMGIQVLDHIIIGDDSYISLKEENFFRS